MTFSGAKCDCIKKPLNGDLVLQILAYVAETERQNTLQRTREGIVAARKRGVKLGRPMKEIPAGFPETMDEWKKQKITLREAAKRMDVDRKTFKKWFSQP